MEPGREEKGGNMANQVQSLEPIRATVSEFYAKDGYVIARGVFSAPLLEELALSLRSVLEKNGHSAEANHNERTVEELIMMRETEAHGLVYNASQSIGSSAAGYRLLGQSGILAAVIDATGF